MDSNTDIDPAEFFETARRAGVACATGTAAEQAARLAEDGLLGVLASEAAGGLNLPLRYAVPVLTATAGALLALPLTETLLLARLAPPDIAAALVAGQTTGTIAWDSQIIARDTNGTVLLEGVAGRAPGAKQAAWVLARLQDGRAALVATDAAGVSVTGGDSFDLFAPDATLRLAGVTAAHILPASAWQAAETDALVLRAAAILGSADICLNAAIEHTTNRRQFGAALIAYQAMRHLLARNKLWLENIRSALDRALTPDASPPDVSSIAPQIAFAAAALHGPAIMEGATQAHGGMGFTWDLDLHRHLRRVRMLEVHGNAHAVRAAIAAALIDPRRSEQDAA